MEESSKNNIPNSEIQAYIDAALSPDEIVDKRIFLVRHGECEDEVKAEYDVNKQKGSTSPLTAKGKEQIQETANYLMNILQDPRSTLAIEHNANNSTRIKQSSAIIQDKIGYTSVRDDERLNSLPPYEEDTQMRAKSAGGDIIYKYYESLQERLKNKYKEDIKYILLMMHKSSISYLEHDFIDTKMGFNITYNYKHGEIRERDYNREGKIIRKHERKDILQIHEGNIREIISILENDDIFIKERKNTLSNIDIIQLQNFINACFRKNPELYEKYLGSENIDLRVFCLTNLLYKLLEWKDLYKTLVNTNVIFGEEKKTLLFRTNIGKRIGINHIMREYDPIYKSYMSSNQVLSKEEKKILLSQINLPEIKKLVMIHFVTKRELRDEEESTLFSGFGLIDFYEDLEWRRTIYEKAVEIQKRSLDKSIVNQYPKAILERKTYIIEDIKRNGVSEQTESENKIKYIKISIGIQEIITGLKLGKQYVLPAHVGSGKSIWSSELVKQLAVDPDVDINFYEGKDFNNIKGLKKRIKGPGLDKQISIVCIDAVDEINNQKIKQIIKETALMQHMGTMVTGRLSEYNNNDNDRYITLSMENISKEEFIKNKIDNPEKRAMILEKLKQSNLSEEIEGNPLLLNFVCILANEKNIFDTIEIKPIETITNKSDLYENIVKLILYKHEGDKSKYYSGNTGKKRLHNDMQLLGKFAHILHTGGNIQDFEKDSLLRDEENFKRFSILFKITENGTYGFIHKSFEEFFLARYLTNQEKGAEEIYKVRDITAGETNRNIWKEFRPVIDFYKEILINQNQQELLEKFLGTEGLLKNDDAFLYNFCMGLDILNKLGKGDFIKNEILIDNLEQQYIDIIKQRKDDEVFSKFLFIHNYLAKGQLDRLNNILYKHIININNNIETHMIFAEIGDREAMHYINKQINILFKEKQYSGVGQIYRRLAKIDDPGIIKDIFEGIDNLLETEEYYEVGQICVELALSRNKEFIKEDYKTGQFISRTLSTKEEFTEKISDYADLLSKKGHTYIADKIHSRLAGKRDSLPIQKEGVKNFFEEEYRIKGKIYLELIRQGDKTTTQKIYEGINQLFEKKAYNTIEQIYLELVKIPNKGIIQKIYEGIKTLVNIGEIEIARKIINSLNNVNNVKQEMIKILGDIGGEENIEFIKSFKDDEDEHVRSEIIRILGEIGGEKNLAFIKSMKEDTP